MSPIMQLIIGMGIDIILFCLVLMIMNFRLKKVAREYIKILERYHQRFYKEGS